MNNIPYKEWSSYILSLLEKYKVPSGTLVELGCGTATLSLLLAQSGYHIIGIDNSKDMLSIAANKTKEQSNISLLLQNMCELDLDNKQTYDAFISVCDSMNYLLYDEEVLATFSGIKEYLKPDGIFLFDLKTPYFYETVLGDNVFCDNQEDCSYTWENSYFPKERINQYDLTIFAKVPKSNLFERFTETHHQRAYHLQEMIDFITAAGLEYVTAYDAFTFKEPHKESERIYIIVRNGD